VAEFTGGSSRNQQKRRLLFWFSCNSKVFPAKLKPGIVFQLNLWTFILMVSRLNLYQWKQKFHWVVWGMAQSVASSGVDRRRVFGKKRHQEEDMT
jgi:hypothetical protein